MDFSLIALKIFYFCDVNIFTFNMDVFTEKVFCGARVEEVVLCFLNDIGGIDEKKEVAVTLLIEVKNQSRHDERFTATGCHVEQQV